MAAAMAARTERIPIRITAVIAPLHDPVHLAEEIAVLDLVSGGRVTYVLGLGYRQAEFDLFGIPKKDRVPRLEATVRTLQAAFRGEALPGRDPSLRITPLPVTPGGPNIALGGGTPVAVRRAARLGMDIITEAPGLVETYELACQEFGTTPGRFIEAPAGAVTAGFVDADPDSAWDRLAPYVLHDARTYAQWNAAAGKSGLNAITDADSVAELRGAGYPYRVFTPAEAVDHIQTFGPLSVAPLCGGAPPEIGWSTLHALAEEVLPRLADR
jgi:alkanesulfonate monooxygenase SsuD/methylene tetrahydromethanopterin reductase-like flavin-dependent oxidoreductase (luciferase family)